jgi:hypothetical protein
MEAARSPETATVSHTPQFDLIRNLFGDFLQNVKNAETM